MSSQLVAGTRRLPAQLIATTPAPPYFSVIFTSVRTTGDGGYGETAQRMVALAEQQDGFLADLSGGFDAYVQSEGAANALGMLCASMVVLAILKNAVHYAALYVMAGIRTGVSRDLRQSLYAQFMDMPMAGSTAAQVSDLHPSHFLLQRHRNI